MKRDMELIRKMLLAIEDAPTAFAPKQLTIDVEDGVTQEQFGYHAYLLINAGLAEGATATNRGSTSPQARISNLTWDGHEFAAAARDETTWRKAMSIVQEKGGAVTLDVVKALLSQLAKAGLGLLV